MDIICARCGKHLSSIEAAREHKCSSRSDDIRPSFKIAPGAKLSADEWNQIVKSLNISGPKPEPKEPVPPKEPKPKESHSTPKLGTKTQPSKGMSVYILLPAILVFSCALIGFGISLFVGTSRPLWVLLAFSIIYSIEKWGRKATINKAIGIPYKLFLNALVLSVLGYGIWFGIKLFSQSLQFNPILSSILFIGELVFFIWLCRVLSINSWRLPSMKLTVFSLLIIAVVFAFAGVEPLSSYKDNIIDSVNDYFEEQQASREAQRLAAEEARIKAEKAAEEERIQAEALKITPVKPPEVLIPEIITPTLRNPSWEELKTFLWEDKTDQLEYIFPTFVCDNFAKTLQANAKEAGWRCAYVSITLEGYPDWFDYGIPSNTGHSLNAFETTGRGLVYIDCTSTHGFSGNADKIIDVKIGKEYIGKSIFPTPGWGEWLSMGTVVGIETTQW